MTAMRTKTIFQAVIPRGYACGMKVYTGVDQLLPQLLMDQLDTLPSHYRHICMNNFDGKK